jgi:flagellar hook-length control protein FliK
MSTQGLLSGKSGLSENNKAFMEIMHLNLGQKSSGGSSDELPRMNSAVKMDKKTDTIPSADRGMTSDERTTLEEKTDAFSKEVEQTVAEELDVSEEDVKEAMESLGLTYLDLTDTGNLAALCAALKGNESTLELLVDPGFTDMLSQIKDLAAALTQETGLSLEGIKEALATQPDDIFSEMLDGAMDDRTETQALPREEITADQELQKAGKDAAAETQGTQETQVTGEVRQQKQTSGESDQMPGQNQRGMLQSRNEDGMAFHAMTQTQSTVYEPATQTVTLETGEQVDVVRIIDQIVEEARAVITEDTSTMEMLLHPEGLGKVLMQVSEKEGAITARIYTQNESVKEALENQMVELKEQLNQGGTRVNSIEIAVAPHEFEKNLEEGQQQNPQEETPEQQQKHARSLRMDDLDQLSGLMTEEEELAVKIMRDRGNTMNLRA